MRNIRIYILCFAAVLGGAAVSSRLFFLQVNKGEYFLAQAESQHQFSKVLSARRGEIFAQNKFGEFLPLAVNKDFDVVFAVPKEIKNPEELAARLSAVLKIDQSEIFAKISKPDDPYELLKKKLAPEEVDALKDLKASGIYLDKETGRFYPSNTLASHLVGFTVAKRNDELSGQYGLEEYYDELLAGKPGVFQGDKDTEGYWIFGPRGRNITPAQDGANLILTVDFNIQMEAEKLLAEAAKKWQAAGGTVAVMEARTGKILALANWPSFNPNEYNKEKVGVFLNAATQTIYEPGSVVKPVTMAAGLDSGAVTPETIYTDAGEVKFGGYTIKNFDGKGRGTVNMIKVLEESLNTGAVFVQQRLGKDLFREYIRAFGFDEKTGVDLPAEVKGKISGLSRKQDINFATASFGQGIAVTPLELIRAVGALANGGNIMRPYLVEKIDYGNGRIEETAPRVERQAVSGQISAKISVMLASVVKNGQAKRARIPGYLVAGKTGTAQIPDGQGGYSSETIHSFVGFAPALSPEFAVLVKLDKPKGIRYAEGSVGPVFRDLTKFILDYYQIPPTE
jgi:cell division protein FtsI/penicillin-binding protein 2